ncbi:MAG: RsmB/NOP family class I SAM-dependent RNA methyltransferase [Devosiaceae bacterium]|nr:RsmB/NOP family class I SAM-dependent RNA methyltransferase [Devosiaceae bacterium]
MRLSGRLAAAIEIIDGLETRRRPVSIALKEWGQANRFAGSKDRAAIGNLVYDVMRKRSFHALAMGETTGRALVLSVAVRDWGFSVEELNMAFSSDNFAPDPISLAEETALSTNDFTAEAPRHLIVNLPEWLVPAFEKTFGKNWPDEARALSERAPLDLRVNTLKSTPQKVSKSLERFAPLPCDLALDGLRIKSGVAGSRTPNVQADESYLKGSVEIQDQGSQIVALLSDAKPGQQVLDYCAGAGGKTMALAACMENKGQIFAYDSDRNRLKPIYDRLKRNAVRNVQVRAPTPEALNNLVAKMDRVVIDAPCTGTGTWRRHPDSKWRLTPEQLEKRVAEQALILEQAARFMQPEGEMIYITCSVLPQENSEQIESFIAKTGIYVPIDLKTRWSETFPEAKHQPTFDQVGLTLSPNTTDTDGFYISILRRKA